ncbi:putative methyltransferase PMT25 [Zea mays]|uniref:Putative methyltransferase PMT25 n=1 Tax=Zea mays TaxID=4577 RepID=A0A1D6MYQ1_MAIZE|nr:putative methyltransferase PMT25 [Zea mays]
MPLFERDRYQRLDGVGARRPPPPPSSFCSSATVVVFVALCLVAAWMMASSNNIAVTVTPENNSGAKDQDGSVDVGGDTRQASDEVADTGSGTQSTEVSGDAGKKDDRSGGDASQTKEDADGDTDNKDGGDASQTKEGADGDTGNNKDDGAGATQTAEPVTTVGNDVNQSDVTGRTDATANGTTRGTDAEDSGEPDSGTVAEGDTPARNQTFSDENGKTEGGEVAKPEDPDKKVEQSAEQTAIDGNTTTSGQDQDENNTDKNTNETGGQADKREEEASTDDKSTGGQADNTTVQEASTTDDNSTGGQANNSTKETPTESKETVGGDDGTAQSQTSFDDMNGSTNDSQPMKEDGKVAENSSDETASGGKVESTDDDATTGAASNNATSGGQNVAAETMAFAAADDGANGNITENSYATNSSATTEGKIPTVGEGDAAEKADLLPSGQAELLNETASAVAENGAFPTQAAESSEEKEALAGKNKKKNQKKKKQKSKDQGAASGETAEGKETYAHTWKLCNASTGADYIPCLDNEAAIKKLKSTKHYEHRERHCPADAPACLVPLPEGYRQPIPWPYSRDKIWYHNVPHTMLASFKGHQNWVKVSGEHLTFPGGGTQFKHGALHYIEVIEEALPEVAWGRRSRVVLDVGCGVASFGGFLFDKDALTMSFAPKDEHEAQVQFALERGIPAVSAVMGTKRLPFPGNAFDVVHCARCRVPWHIEGGTLLLEVNRLLRPGGLFVWSATPVYQKVPEDVEIWHAMAALTKSMCWEIVKKTSDTVDETAMVVFKKPTSNECYDARTRAEPPLCGASDDQDAAWNVTLRPCMHRVPTDASARGSRWPTQWPQRLATTPYWLSADQTGVYGKPAPADFAADQEHWRKVVDNSYRDGMGIDWKNVRNVMDMRAVYGGCVA